MGRRTTYQPGVCLECTRFVPSIQPRGLCPRCYQRPDIRCRYPAHASYRSAPGSGTGNQRVPAKRPTDELPATAGKIAEMAERARLGQQLFHEDDAARSEE